MAVKLEVVFLEMYKIVYIRYGEKSVQAIMKNYSKIRKVDPPKLLMPHANHYDNILP